jgi:DNA-binding response OmpR family regulator
MTNGLPPMILVVDHERDRREALQALLTHAGHQVCVAEDGLKALKIGLDVKPDIALIHMTLPGLGGYAVAQGLRAAAEGRRMHLIAMTGQRHDRQRALGSGFDMHIPSPVDPSTLLEVIASLRKPDEPAA